MKAFTLLSVVLFCAAAAQATQFSYLDPGYAQEIFAAPLTFGQEAGMAWTTSGNLLTRAGSTIFEHSLTQNATYQGTNLHGVTLTHPITGLSTSGYGMTSGKDGYIYTATATGLERFKPSNWAAPAQALAGTVGGAGWGITTLMDGRIAYSDGNSPSNIYVYDPAGGTNSLIYTVPGGVQVDDIEASTTGQIALAGHSNSTITIISYAGAWINTFSTPHFPDGLAFGDGAASSSLFSNNNNGSITRYDLSPNFANLITTTDIATNLYTGGSTGGAYGDLASVGPDCAFYVTQYENGGSNGSTPGVGTHWDNGSTTNEPSIIRISALGLQSDGTIGPVCGFSSTTPEPATLSVLALGALTALRRRRR
ncbi:MAG: PEP-CTERM sorting domain-containing protein [Planctomycetota bacterium]|nr:PEP-CTERM sorting domain-containing protein [Planctomycetota bacterium]